jgi:hypothetical protein
MRPLTGALLAFVFLTLTAAQSPDEVLSNRKLSVHTLLREDVFAGFKSDNFDRLARAERHIEILLKDRPEERANLVAWKAGASVNRAVHALEAGQRDEYDRRYADALAGFAEAGKATSGNNGVAAITGGTLSVFADRLAEPHRAAAWALAYSSYSKLWQEQGADLEKMPVHHRGEVLSGLAQSAQRTGRQDEATLYVDKMLALLAGTPYEAMAKSWKADPAGAATTNLTCKTCHSQGRLENRLAALKE